MADVVRWTFYDPTVPETYTFHLNPSEGGSPDYRKNIAYETTAAPDGKTLIFEGRDNVQKLTWSGTILEENHYNAFVTWFQKRRQIKVTDDLGREMWIYISEFVPKRERAIHYPWKHSYTCTATILNWA